MTMNSTPLDFSFQCASFKPKKFYLAFFKIHKKQKNSKLESTRNRPGSFPEGTHPEPIQIPPGADPETTRNPSGSDPKPTPSRPGNHPEPTRNPSGSDPEPTRSRPGNHHFRKRFVKQITHTNEIDSNI
jgi:hypothetical protein